MNDLKRRLTPLQKRIMKLAESGAFTFEKALREVRVFHREDSVKATQEQLELLKRFDLIQHGQTPNVFIKKPRAHKKPVIKVLPNQLDLFSSDNSPIQIVETTKKRVRK